jgi:hypothetical protein
MGYCCRIFTPAQPVYPIATEGFCLRCSQTLLGYVAGQPFALLDPNDPDIATKIVWNNVFRPITTDDYDLRFFDCQEQYPKLGGAHRVINDIEVGRPSIPLAHPPPRAAPTCSGPVLG